MMFWNKKNKKHEDNDPSLPKKKIPYVPNPAIFLIGVSYDYVWDEGGSINIPHEIMKVFKREDGNDIELVKNEFQLSNTEFYDDYAKNTFMKLWNKGMYIPDPKDRKDLFRRRVIFLLLCCTFTSVKADRYRKEEGHYA